MVARRHSKVFVLVLVAAVLICWSLPGTAAAEKLRISLNFLPYGLHLGFFAAKDKGFYKEAGFDEVEIVRGHGSGDTVKRIGIRDFDLGFADLLSMAVGINKGLKEVAVGMVLDIGPACIYSLEKSGIKTLKDLEGRKVGALKASAIRAVTESALHKNNLDPNKLNWVSMPGSAYVGSLMAGRVEAIATYATTRPNYINAAAEYAKKLPQAERAGYKVNEMWLADYGVEVYGAGLIANADFLKEKPDVVRRYVQATMKGYAWAIEHPQEAVDIFLKTHPESSAEAVRVQFAVTAKSLLSPTAEKLGIGHITKEKMETTRRLGLLGMKVRPDMPPTEAMYTNEFLPELFPKPSPLLEQWLK